VSRISGSQSRVDLARVSIDLVTPVQGSGESNRFPLSSLLNLIVVSHDLSRRGRVRPMVCASISPPVCVNAGMDLYFLQQRLASPISLRALSVKELAENRFTTSQCGDIFYDGCGGSHILLAFDRGKVAP
jgi:hypothetical protein